MRVRFGTMSMLAATAVLAVASGCTNSDFIQPGNGRVAVVISGVNTESHFTDSPSDQAIISLGDIRVRPNDQQADDTLGSDVIALVTSNDPATSVNFAVTESSTVGPVGMTGGSYRLESLRISQVRFQDSTTPAPGGATCKEAATRIRSLTEIVITPTQVGVTPNLTIGVDQPGEFEIRFDVDAFLDAIVANASNCTPPTCSCSSVNVNAVGALAPTYLSFP